MKLDIIIPGLLSESEASLIKEISLPYLQLFISRAESVSAKMSSHSWLSEQCQLAELPIAAAAAKKLGLPAKEGYWLCADPVKLQVTQNTVYCLGNASLDLNAQEAAVLIESLNAFLSTDGIRFFVGESPTKWYMRVPEEKFLLTTPLSEVIGKNILNHLPQGEDASLLEALLAEIQMLLYAHPINIKRREQGLSSVDSLWVYGNGYLPVSIEWPWDLTVSDDLAISGFAQLAGKVFSSMPLQFGALTLNQANVLIYYSAVQEALFRSDHEAYLKALQNLDEFWLKPIIGALKSGKISEIHLQMGQRQFLLKKSMLYRFWKRKQSVAAVLC